MKLADALTLGVLGIVVLVAAIAVALAVWLK